MGDLLWEPQQHAIRMLTRTPQLLIQNKLRADSLLKQPKKKQREKKICRGHNEIRRLVEERQNTARGDKHHLKEFNKRIKTCIRDRKRAKRQEKIQRILEECRGIKSFRKIWKEKNAFPESEKRQKARQLHQEKVLQEAHVALGRAFLAQVVCRICVSIFHGPVSP